jgi:PleD family two-component response regulator
VTTSHSEPGIGTESRPIVVLLIDDQRFVHVAVRHLLALEPDIELYHCEDAGDAVAHANRIAPTVILQDLVMPDIEGLTLVELFRRNPVTANTPIVVLSDNDDESTRAQAKTAGADDYLVKWPDRQTLGACLRRHAHRYRVATPRSASSATPDINGAPDD